MYRKTLVSQGIQIDFDKIEDFKNTDMLIADVMKDGMRVAMFPKDRYELKYFYSFYSDISKKKTICFELKEK